MYTAYFVNSLTGELKRTSDPRDNPMGGGWQSVTESTYDLYQKIAQWAEFHAKN